MRSASALVLLVAVSCALWRLPADAPPAGAAPPPLPRPAAAAPAAAHIVRFREYLHAAEHRTRLEAALPPAAAGWAWVPRDNPAAALPTDFGLVRLTAGGGAGGAAALAALAALPFVRDVHADAMIRRSPLAFREEALDADLDAELDLAAGAGAFGPCAPGAPPGCVLKHPGRILTRPTFALADNAGHAGGNASAADPAAARRRLRLDAAAGAASLPVVLGADKLWAAGFDGTGIKVGIFDTGIKDDHPDVRSVEERTNWTHEPTLEDGLGHGSFVAGVVGGRDAGCPGLAPGASLHTFRVFTNDQVSFTSWFLDAFNYAIATEMDLVNLSIGGPDWLDAPFVDKVREVTAAGIIMVSAIGNDGPAWGTLNNPADAPDVLGVGGVGWDGALAGFSSRGMTTWELPTGAGRLKPDVVAYGRDVRGSKIGGGCRALSGTSVASPVVAGAAALLLSTVPAARRAAVLNPGALKQALVEGAAALPGLRGAEQGAGLLALAGARAVLEAYAPRASAIPAALNMTSAACPYAWPHCRQPLRAGAMPRVLNVTLANGMGSVGYIRSPPAWAPADAGGALLDVRFEFSETLWPWSGYLAVYIRVRPEGATFSGPASGTITLEVISPPARGETNERRSTVTIPLSADVAPPPPRSQRLLWDVYHSIRYPPAYLPRDDLSVRHDVLDWHGDHPATNYHSTLDALLDAGFAVDLLASPATCFDAGQYGALLVFDAEEEWHAEEVDKIAGDVKEKGLGLVVFADWYDLPLVRQMRFYDDNTRSWWEAATGGANAPALNDLLRPLGAALAGGAWDVEALSLPGAGPAFRFASGSALGALPAGGFLHNATATGAGGDAKRLAGTRFAALGLTDAGAGRLALYGDSNCLDSSHRRGADCAGLLKAAIAYVTRAGGEGLAPAAARLAGAFGSTEEAGLPRRREDYDFREASRVLGAGPPVCLPNAPLAAQGLSFDSVKEEKAEEEAPEEAALERPGGANGGARDTAKRRAAGEEAEEEAPALPLLERINEPRERPRAPAALGVWPLDVPARALTAAGAVALLALWSAARRRRPSGAGGAANGGAGVLPTFWRRRRAGRG